MADDLLGSARRQAEKANPSMRAAALLRIARAESAENLSRARTTLLEGLDVMRDFPRWKHRQLFEEARCVAAAVSPERLDEFPTAWKGGHEPFASGNLVQVMLAHGHHDAAVNYLLHYADPVSFPFAYIGNVFYELDRHSSDSSDRRVTILRHAVKMWRRSPSLRHPHAPGGFVPLFAHFWKELPREEAIAVARTIVEKAAEEPEAENWGAGYPDEIRFTSPRQNTLFQILHVLRHLDPALAQSLIDTNDQLAIAARRYPNGLETMNQELEAEVKRRKAGASREGGYILMGDPADFDRQRKLIDATRRGEFETLIVDAIEQYREDTSPETRNYAPKEYWPSTGAFRKAFYEAGKQLGAEGTQLLTQIPDDDLRLFAMVELAAGLAGLPAASITQMKQPRPRPASMFQVGRIVDAGSLEQLDRERTDRATMRSTDGRLIRCPNCLLSPPSGFQWNCKCGHLWNTFLTAGKCPACHFQWEITGCPHCGEAPEHQAWYVSES
jgi:hypothetical protein